MFRLRTFGGLALDAADGQVTGRPAQPRRLALLALVATTNHGRGVSRDSLQALLWPESDAESARHSLYQALHVLRHDLGIDDLILGTAELRLNPTHFQADITEFQSSCKSARNEQLVELYAGPFLQGFYLRGAAEFERWVESRRDEFARAWHGAVESLADRAAAAGRHRDAAGWWRRITEAEPLDATAALGLVKALADAGDRSGALAQAERHAQAMEQELGMAPDSELISLCQRLRDPPPLEPPHRVRRSTPTSTAPAIGQPANHTASGTANQLRPLRFRRFLRTRPAHWAGAAVGLGLAVALVLWTRLATSREPPIGDAPATMPLLAVLPFENLGDSADAYFTEGLSDEITTRLAGVPGLGVISRRSAMQYNATSKPLTQIGTELGVAYVLEGTVRWDRAQPQGGRVRVTPQLIRIEGDRQVWAESFDVNLSDVFGVQGQIAQEVTQALNVALLPTERVTQASTKTPDLAAYDAYLRGNAAFFRMATTGGNVAVADTAIAAYREAVRIDSTFALAWARLAQAITPLLAGATTSPQANARLAKEAAQRAIALAPNLAEAQLALSAVSGGNANKEALKRAYAAAPTDPQVLQVLARRTREAAPREYDVLVFTDVDSSDSRWRCRSALQLLRRAAVLDPRSIPILRELFFAHACLGEVAPAESALGRAIDVAPGLAEQWQLKAGLRLQEGDLTGARSVLEEAKRYVPRAELVAYMGAINDQYWVLGDADQRFLLHLRPTSFGGDSLGWALTLAHTAALRADSVTARAYADTALRVIQGRPRFELAVYEAIALAYLRRGDEALIALRRAAPTDFVQATGGWGYVQLQGVRTYMILGENDRAIDAFQQFVQMTGDTLPLGRYWRLDPIVRPLAGDPRFEALFQQDG